jgi:hypothetical protein
MLTIALMDAFGDDNPERKLRSGGKIEDLNNPTMGFDQKAHVSLVDIIPGHLAAIRREITILRTGDTSTPLTVYDFQRRSFTDQKTMDKVVIATGLAKTPFFTAIARTVRAFEAALIVTST